MNIAPIRLLQDNYGYLVWKGSNALVIDPSEAAPISRAVRERGLRLKWILNTHHHHDHIGGNHALAAEFGAEIFCSAVDRERIPGAARGLKDGDQLDLDGMKFEVLAIPGHTRGQVAYYAREARALFVGDTLFAMGCGRLFEGTAQEMFQSLARIRSLDPETQLYFGHEYTQRNGDFALSVDPGNPEISQRALAASSAPGGIVPAPTIGDELAVNPFLRTDEAAIRHTLGLESADDLAVFTELRQRRDRF